MAIDWKLPSINPSQQFWLFIVTRIGEVRRVLYTEHLDAFQTDEEPTSQLVSAKDIVAWCYEDDLIEDAINGVPK